MVQAYRGGDGGSGDVVERPDQAALPDFRRNLLKGGGRRGGRGQARFLPRRFHGAPNLLEIFTGPVVDNPHRDAGRKNMLVCKNQNYLKNRVKS